MTKSRLKDALILLLITIIAGVGLGAMYAITKEPIAQAEETKQQNAYREVLPEAAKFVEYKDFNADEAEKVLEQTKNPEGEALSVNNDIDACVQGVDNSGKLVGYVINVTSHAGYGGDIVFSVGYKADGTVTGYSMITINETAGLGMKATESSFKDQFNNKKEDQFEVTKTGATSDNQIEAISGATITSKAVTYGVDSVIAYGKSLVEQTKGEVQS